MTELLTEERLSRALRAVAAAAVPDDAVPDLGVGPASLGVAGDGDTSEPAVADGWSFPSRRRRVGRGLGVLGAAVALGGAATGIAAAAGAFSTAGVRLIAPAIGTILPTGRWTAANVTTRITEAGPDGSTVVLETASADAAGGCKRLVVSAPGAPSTGKTVSCGEIYNTLHPPTTHTPSTTDYGTASSGWVGPGGTQWLFIYGRAQTPNATSVGAVSSTGTVLATAPVSKGWFVLWFLSSAGTGPKTGSPQAPNAPTGTQPTGGRHLVYYGPTGRQTGAYPTL